MAKKVIPVLLVIVFLVIGYTIRHKIKSFFREDTRSVNSVEVKLLFRDTLNPEIIADVLVENGIMKKKEDVINYYKDNNLLDARFSPGKYIVLPQTHMSDLLEGFIDEGQGHGKSEVKVNVLFNNCRDIYDMGSNISQCILADSASIVNYLLSKETLQELQVTEEQLPALFIPKQYQMYFDTDAKGFVDFMMGKYHEFWTAERLEKLKRVGLKSPEQAATLASVIYSEQSRMSEEWPVIARLYLNRLEKGMKLQSDPTFRFCWGHELDGVEHLLNKHKEIDCPYNTYLYEGLPPGPICLVPAAVIDAVLNPDDNEFLFMMAKPGGKGHNFARTNSEHEKNVVVYKRWLKEYMKNKQND